MATEEKRLSHMLRGDHLPPPLGRTLGAVAAVIGAAACRSCT